VSPEAALKEIKQIVEGAYGALDEEMAGKKLLDITDRAGAPESGDVIYVRHAEHGVRLALVTDVGTGAKHEGLIQVLPWIEVTGQLAKNRRWVSRHDLRGWPSADDRRLRDIAKAVARAAS